MRWRWIAALILLWTSPALADDAAAPKIPRIQVTGRATVEAPPDFAALSIGVTVRAPTTAAALDGTSAAAARIVEAAKAAQVTPRDIQTGTLSLQPAFRTVSAPGGGSEQRPDGYTASNAVTVRVRDLGRLGEVLRTVVDGGANRIGGVEFGLADPGALSLKAIDAAVRNARQQADTMAAAAGVKLGRIESIRSSDRNERPMPLSRSRMGAMAAMPAPPVPVEAGSLEMTAEVDVTWAIE